jgi:antitoxin component YwqK of YwqJK toxin-antitoxin module
MKRLLLIVLPLLLIVGCSSPEPINYETTLVDREGVFYTKDTNKPYSGQVFSLYDDGKKKKEGTLKDGKMITYKHIEWFDNGQKEWERTYKDGKKDGLITVWYGNGQKEEEGTYKGGKFDGLLTIWYQNGQKKSEMNWKDGTQDGLSTDWYENGQKKFEWNYKDGGIVLIGKWNEDGSVLE